MYHKRLVSLFLLGLTLTACSFGIRPPAGEGSGPTKVDEITIPAASATQATDLSIVFGAGTLKLHPGTNSLISGTATYNVEDFKPQITVNGNEVRIEQGKWELSGFPDMSNVRNEWDLALGETPLDLNIEAGAYKAEYDFGGLALVNLSISDGAADVKLTFSRPNQTEMGLFRYETGASNVTLTNLCNANFNSLDFNSGAGNYTLDFGGELKRQASVNIETGVSNLTLVIPAGLEVQITVEGGLSNVSAPAGWDKNGNVYTQTGSGPQLTIMVEMGAGNLTITR